MELIIKRPTNTRTLLRLIIFAKNKIKRKLNLPISNKIFRISNKNVVVIHSRYKDKININVKTEIENVFLNQIK